MPAVNWNMLSSANGASSIEHNSWLWRASAIPSGQCGFFPINNFGSSCWSSCWSSCDGGWNGGLHNFAEIIDNRKEVSVFDCFLAGFKESLYVNPLGSLGQIISSAGIGANMIGTTGQNIADWWGGNQRANV